MSQAEWANKDYYADLGVSSSASADEIKRVYRKLAMENHPDKNPGNSAAEEKFKRIAEAYDVIGDEKTRAEYDEFKKMVGAGGFFGGGSGFSGGFRPGQGAQADFNIGDLFGQGQAGFGGEGGLGDILGGLFSRSGGRPRRPSQPSRGADIETEITLDFREAVTGKDIPLQLTADSPCSNCHGTGSESGKSPQACPDCHGTGFTTEQKGAFGLSAPCHTCHGTGQTIPDPCHICGGTGTVKRSRSITVRIPEGVRDGQKVRLAGQGEAGPNGKPAGDLFVNVHVREDKVFTRSGNNLEVTVPVTFAEAALGETIAVPTITDPVKVKLPVGTPNGRTLRVKGRGVKGGDLLVMVDVKIPTSLDPAAMSALRTYAQAERESGFRPRSKWVGNERG